MKSLSTVLKIFTLLAVIAFSMAACDNGTTANSDPVPIVIPIIISGTLDGGTLAGGGSGEAAINTDGLKFNADVKSDNTITGKLQDGDVIYNLTGTYDPATKVFTMDAASGTMVFSITGFLDSNNNFIPSTIQATVQVINNYEWVTYIYNATPGDEKIDGEVTVTDAVEEFPSWSQGTWYDQLAGRKIIITKSSITVFDDEAFDPTSPYAVQVITGVEIEKVNEGAMKLVCRYTIFNGKYYSGHFYFANSFDNTLKDAIGNKTLGDLGVTGDYSGVTLTEMASYLGNGDKLFMAPYCSNDVDKIDESETDTMSSDGYSPLFDGFYPTADAKAATELKAVHGVPMVLLPNRPTNPGGGSDSTPNIHGTITLINIPTNPAPKKIWINFNGYPTGGGVWGNNSKGENGVTLINGGAANLPWLIHVDKFKWWSGSGEFFPADLQFRVSLHFDGGDNDPRNYDVDVPGELFHFDSMEEVKAANINLGTVDLTKPEWW